MGKFEVYNDAKGGYRFRLKAANGQVILASQGYKEKAGCANGIESVKKNAQDSARFEKLQSKSGDWYFNLKSTNGQVVGTSQMYSSEAAMDNGIESVSNNAPDAETVEE
jgi:uncharacterized protein YegP (UPF0339 family)